MPEFPWLPRALFAADTWTEGKQGLEAFHISFVAITEMKLLEWQARPINVERTRPLVKSNILTDLVKATQQASPNGVT